MAGFDAANAGRATLVSALLIAAVADNLTDSLSVHMYQESERLERKEAFVGTLSNFVTRLLLCLSFVLIVLLFQTQATATVVGIVWGMTLLCGSDLRPRSEPGSQRNVRDRKTSDCCVVRGRRQQVHRALDHHTFGWMIVTPFNSESILSERLSIIAAAAATETAPTVIPRH